MYVGIHILLIFFDRFSVNHTPLNNVSHETAIEELRNAGDEVTLYVKHYKSAAPFLLKNMRQLIPEQEAGGAINAISHSHIEIVLGVTFVAEIDEPEGKSRSRQASSSSSGGGRSRAPPLAECASVVSPSPFSGGANNCRPMDSPSSVASDASGSNWYGVIPRVRRKYVDVIEGEGTRT